VLATAALVSLVGVIGVASLVASFILGPFAKLKLAIKISAFLQSQQPPALPRLISFFPGRASFLLHCSASRSDCAGVYRSRADYLEILGAIKAFFGGFLSGIWQGLAPLRAAFSAMAPVFSALGNGIKAIWEWFKNLLSPMQTSKDTLDKCASAGRPSGG
jgi:hypothetical protein